MAQKYLWVIDRVRSSWPDIGQVLFLRVYGLAKIERGQYLTRHHYSWFTSLQLVHIITAGYTSLQLVHIITAGYTSLQLVTHHYSWLHIITAGYTSLQLVNCYSSEMR